MKKFNDIEMRQFSYRVETKTGQVFDYNDVTSVVIVDGILTVQTSSCINCFSDTLNAYEIQPPFWVAGEIKDPTNSDKCKGIDKRFERSIKLKGKQKRYNLVTLALIEYENDVTTQEELFKIIKGLL